jgi:hypothetical protein
MKKKETKRILASITDIAAARTARFFGITVAQAEEAFNVYDNCVISGEAEAMSIGDVGIRFRQCVTGAMDVKDGMVWNRVAREYRDNYNSLRRKVWK